MHSWVTGRRGAVRAWRLLAPKGVRMVRSDCNVQGVCYTRADTVRLRERERVERMVGRYQMRGFRSSGNREEVDWQYWLGGQHTQAEIKEHDEIEAIAGIVRKSQRCSCR
jgi:hypothetical protein